MPPTTSQSDNTLLNTNDEALSARERRLRFLDAAMTWSGDAGAPTRARGVSRLRRQGARLLSETAGSASAKRDLEWFFDDWVYRDRGLPDFRVESAYARKLLTAMRTNIPSPRISRIAAARVQKFRSSVATAKGEKTVRVLVKAHEKAVARIDLPVRAHACNRERWQRARGRYRKQRLRVRNQAAVVKGIRLSAHLSAYVITKRSKRFTTEARRSRSRTSPLPVSSARI